MTNTEQQQNQQPDPKEHKHEEVVNRFTYHPPFGDQAVRYEILREEFRQLAHVIVKLTPISREQSLALTDLQRACMMANAAIACNEKPEEGG
jgi:hypothetical protein